MTDDDLTNWARKVAVELCGEPAPVYLAEQQVLDGRASDGLDLVDVDHRPQPLRDAD